MITVDGYSKDPNIVPEGIVVTFGKEMIMEQGGSLNFLRYFESSISEEGNYWLHKCKNKPSADIIYVYVICMNRLYCRCYFGGYEKAVSTGYKANSKELEIFDWPRIILAGPIEKPGFKRTLKGFQGFRYSTKLF